MSTSERRPIGDDHEPDIDAPDHRSEDIVGIIDGSELIIEDASDDPDAFERWISIHLHDDFAVDDIVDWR